MKKEQRANERVNVCRSATLISPCQKEITATLANISLGGLLLCNPSSPVEDCTPYNIEILATNNQSIFLSGIPVWKDRQQVGIKIIRYRFDSREIIASFIEDLKVAAEIVNLLDDGWLDYLLEDDKGKQLKIQYD